jgi:prepilin-type N-terminal cleavage/methylation domain-containing protein
MNKKGFTLVELIISIALLSLIGISIGTTLNKSYKKSLDNEYDEFINKIESSANVYASADTSILNQLETSKGFIDIEAKELIDSGILSTDLVNPKTGNKIQSSDKIRVTLDDNGTLKFEFNPENTEDYLKMSSIIVKVNSGINSINAFDKLNTTTLGYIVGSDGSLKSDYFKVNENIKITNSNNNGIISINSTQIGSMDINYSYKTMSGVWKSAIRKVLVVDGVSPTALISTTSAGVWTKGTATINISISDNDALSSYCLINDIVPTTFSCTSANCNSISSNPFNISTPVSKSGDYYVCAKDRSGNTGHSSSVNIKVDNSGPEITNTTNNSTYASAINLTFTLTDSQSGLSAYSVTTSSSTPTSWISISGAPTSTQSYSISKPNGTYYIWAKDVVGNQFSKAVTIDHVATLKTAYINVNELNSSSYVSNSYYTGNNIKAINSATTSSGSLSGTPTFSGSFINYNVYPSSYTSSCPVTKYESANSTGYSSNTTYSCDYGGSYNSWSGRCEDYYNVYSTLYDTLTCTGSTAANRRWTVSQYKYDCSGNCYQDCNYNYTYETGSCSENYSTGGSCSTQGATKTGTRSCTAGCSMSYYATPNENYYCSYPYEEYAGGCYYCSSGYRSGTQCVVNTTESCTKYKYYITVSYWS